MRRSGVITVPAFSSGRESKSNNESKSNKTRPRATRLGEVRAKGKKYFWIVLVSVIGLSAGWMLGQSWISAPQLPEQEVTTQVAAIEPSTSIRSEQSAEENATASAPSDQSDQVAQSVEQDSQPNYHDQKPNKARRTRAARASAQGGPVTTMLKPFKAINPLKLRKLRLW